MFSYDVVVHNEARRVSLACNFEWLAVEIFRSRSFKAVKVVVKTSQMCTSEGHNFSIIALDNNRHQKRHIRKKRDFLISTGL